MESETTQSTLRCRFCQARLHHTFVDLGMSPLCQTHIGPDELDNAESFYPLRVYICTNCFLVQLPEYVAATEIFAEYAYFSSYVDTLLRQAQQYVESMVARFRLGKRSRVVEVASNDGYLLQYFVQKGIPVLGVEPAANIAKAAQDRGVPTIVEFFGEQVAKRMVSDGLEGDLILGNNVLPHVPDINDFLAGFKVLMKRDGLMTVDFQHLVTMIDGNQFDTIYHEHFSYLSFTTVCMILAAHGLKVFDVEELQTHGGSLRVFACHDDDTDRQVTDRVEKLLSVEQAWGVDTLSCYQGFDVRVRATKRDILKFLIEAKEQGKRVVGYGAPGKGNTLLNYCGIRTDLLDFTVDRNPHKQGKFTPGTRIPIVAPECIEGSKPDYLFILPWNLKDEIIQQVSSIREWGGKFVIPIPDVTVIP